MAILRRRFLWIVVLAIVAGGIGYATAPRTIIYRSSATIYVGPRVATGPGAAGVSNAAIDAIEGLDRIIATYSVMIRSRPIAADALARAKIDRSVDSVLAATKATPEPATLLLRVQVTDVDPAVAQRLANAMAESFVDAIQSLEPSSAPREGEVPQLPANLFERAALPLAPQPTGALRRTAAAAVVGALAGVALAFLRENLDVTVRDVRDVEHRLELPVLGVIPLDETGVPPSRPRTAATHGI